MTAKQASDDCKYLETALAAGPSRYEQLVPGIYEIYRRHGFNPAVTTPANALAELRCMNEGAV